MNESLAEVYGQVADRSRERLKKRSGGIVCKLAKRGKGRAYGKNS